MLTFAIVLLTNSYFFNKYFRFFAKYFVEDFIG